MGVEVEERFERTQSIRAFDRGDVTVVIGRDGSAREFSGESALLVRELLRFVTAPRSVADIVAHFEEVAEGASDVHATIGEALRVLREAGAVVPANDRRFGRPKEGNGRIVLGITGAIAAAHVPRLVDRLLRSGFEVRVAMTRAATRFVSPDALRALTHRHVHRNLWAGSPDAPAPHIELAEWADIVVIAPASATTLSRMARGDCSDIVSAIALATRAPVLVAPSMNVAMHDAPAIARNVAQLTDDGFYMLYPSIGVEVADAPESRRPVYGSWPSPDDIVAAVEHIRRRARPSERSSEWDAIYRDTPADRLPFHTETLDADLRELLSRVKQPATLWDIGTGLGAVARAASRLGFTVLGTDLSPRAIERASAETADGLRLQVDDITQSRVEGTFDVIIDRGCFHTLDATGARRYADAVWRRTRTGSQLVLKLHAGDEPRPWRTTRYRVGELEAMFAPHFTLTSWSASTIPGAIEPAARAWLAVFTRAGAS